MSLTKEAPKNQSELTAEHAVGDGAARDVTRNKLLDIMRPASTSSVCFKLNLTKTFKIKKLSDSKTIMFKKITIKPSWQISGLRSF